MNFCFRDDVEIIPTPNTLVKHEGENAKLKISPVKFDQEGVYKCVATNSAGTADCVAKVTVEGEQL